MIEQLAVSQATKTTKATTAQRLRRIVRRRVAWPNDQGVIQVAARVLGIDPTDPLEDHPLAVLCQVLHLSEAGAEVLRLAREHCALLTEAINRLEGRTSDEHSP